EIVNDPTRKSQLLCESLGLVNSGGKAFEKSSEPSFGTQEGFELLVKMAEAGGVLLAQEEFYGRRICNGKSFQDAESLAVINNGGQIWFVPQEKSFLAVMQSVHVPADEPLKLFLQR